ncbi:alcohol dehydrogenase catalytic domain-containing protein [Pseudonocardia sp. DSM 110487]|uniref:alcohol dehydrogenase catalytic domain-containing protein n=1 Tax=Pseudonocardia sp. DSM 110487 TaxID=2865833 RepID=UPI001C69681E|nr:alcohol dehydrogenase catalytic domain-containing protein [Pseudonocardia sp. DSM 110487]QYN34059.1 alcohol dehydrogenase catalytic domain-containing protein [Pseudonocardia sp. DSM 110487]
MRELHFTRDRRLAWHERDGPALQDPTDAIVRPFVAGRCDGDTLPLHRRVSRAMQAGLRLGAIDPAVGSICGPVPFKGPFAIGHECVAEVLAVGDDVRHVRAGQTVVVPWAVSCGTCERCRRGLTAKCATTTDTTLAAFGFGPASGPWGGMIADEVRVPHADHMLVPVPAGTPALRVAAASDNLADAWRTVVPPLTERGGGSVLVLGGGAKSIGLYAAGLAVAHGASVVDYLDRSPARRQIAETFGARAHPYRRGPATNSGYDVVVEATSSTSGLQRAVRAVAPGGICTAVGYYIATATPVPVMHMYATDATLRLGVSHTRAILPDLLGFVHRTGFPAERVTTLTADWDDAPTAYAARTTKVVLHRDRITAEEAPPS